MSMIRKFKTLVSELPKTMPHKNYDDVSEDNFELVESCQNVVFGDVNWGRNDYRNYDVQVSTMGHQIVVTCKKGWVFDMASIPKIFWWIGHPASPKFQRAATIHDAMYELRLGRKDSDDVFYRVLREDGVGVIKASLMWAAVRLGGWTAYLGNRR